MNQVTINKNIFEGEQVVNADKGLPSYDIKRVIGSGSFGYVFEAWDNIFKRTVALKRVEKVGNKLSREYQILQEIQSSDYVVKVYDFFYTRTSDQKLIQNTVFEYCDLNLEQILQDCQNNRQSIDQHQIKIIFFQILIGLRDIHQKNICHRDLKPENVLITTKDEIKICDFGSSKILDKNGKNTPYVVSRYYRAPELIIGLTNYQTKIDIWGIFIKFKATACIIFELKTLNILFKGKSEGDQLNQIFSILGSPNDEDIDYYKGLTPFDPDLIDKFRGFNGIKLNGLFQKYIPNSLLDLLNQMLKYNPDERISAEDALKHKFFDPIRHLYYH